jgi:hypothetical protein
MLSLSFMQIACENMFVKNTEKTGWASSELLFIISGSLHLNLDLFKRLDIFLGPQLTSLVSEVAEQCSRQATTSSTNSVDPSPKFVYFNKLNLAQKSTVHLDNRRSGNVAVTPEVLRLLADINADKARYSQQLRFSYNFPSLIYMYVCMS